MAEPVDRWPDIQAAIDALGDEEQRVALVRLAAKFNNGSEHFDHSPHGSSWLCLRCRRDRADSFSRDAAVLAGDGDHLTAAAYRTISNELRRP